MDRNRALPVPEVLLTVADLISIATAISDLSMRCGILILAWYLLLVLVLGILSRCHSLGALTVLPSITTACCSRRCEWNSGVRPRILLSATSSAWLTGVNYPVRCLLRRCARLPISCRLAYSAYSCRRRSAAAAVSTSISLRSWFHRARRFWRAVISFGRSPQCLLLP